MDKLTKQNFIEMIRCATTQINENHEYLSKLDAATGDGDHGVTIKRTMDAILKGAEEKADGSFAELQQGIAMSAMMCDGGSTSPLVGSWFMGMGMAAPSDSLSASETAAMFQSGLTNMLGISKAELGNKTMMDALIPATEAINKGAGSSEGIEVSMKKAADAAAEGAEKTKEYQAKFGRARTMGERAIGHIDAGAVSISLIFKGFSEALQG